MSDTFHSDIPDLSKFMKSLDMLDENVSKAAVTGLKKGADIIVNAQKRRISAKSQRLADAISKGTIYTTKKGSVGISTDKRIMLKDLIPQYSTIHIADREYHVRYSLNALLCLEMTYKPLSEILQTEWQEWSIEDVLQLSHAAMCGRPCNRKAVNARNFHAVIALIRT